MKIAITNTAKLAVAITLAEGRSRDRLIVVEDIRAACAGLEKQLATRLLKKDWAGLRFTIDVHARKFPNTYNGRPLSTQFTVERTATGWAVTDIGRYDCNGPEGRVRPHNIHERSVQLVAFAGASKNWC